MNIQNYITKIEKIKVSYTMYGNPVITFVDMYGDKFKTAPNMYYSISVDNEKINNSGLNHSKFEDRLLNKEIQITLEGKKRKYVTAFKTV